MKIVGVRSVVRRRSRPRRGAALDEQKHPVRWGCGEGEHGVGAGWRMIARVMWMSSIVVLFDDVDVAEGRDCRGMCSRPFGLASAAGE